MSYKSAYRQKLIACPIKGWTCTAKKPRLVFLSTLQRQQRRGHIAGICGSCKARPSFLEIQEKIPKVIAVRTSSKYSNRTEVLIDCPIKGYNCSALKPRWLQA